MRNHPFQLKSSISSLIQINFIPKTFTAQGKGDVTIYFIVFTDAKCTGIAYWSGWSRTPKLFLCIFPVLNTSMKRHKNVLIFFQFFLFVMTSQKRPDRQTYRRTYILCRDFPHVFANKWMPSTSAR